MGMDIPRLLTPFSADVVVFCKNNIQFTSYTTDSKIKKNNLKIFFSVLNY